MKAERWIQRKKVLKSLGASSVILKTRLMCLQQFIKTLQKHLLKVDAFVPIKG